MKPPRMKDSERILSKVVPCPICFARGHRYGIRCSFCNGTGDLDKRDSLGELLRGRMERGEDLDGHWM